MRIVVALAALFVGTAGAFLVEPASAQPANVLKTGVAGLFWFDSKAISASGQPFYGAHAYRALLPEFSPRKRIIKGAFAYFDGDLLAQTPFDIPRQGPLEAAVAEQAQRLGGLAYVVAIYSYQDGPPFREVDRALRAAKVTGYLGLTTTTPMDIDRFIGVTRQMSLPVAMKQEGTKLRIVNLEFVSLPDLRKLGFEPELAAK